MDIQTLRTMFSFNKRTLKYIGISCLLYIFFLIINIPASFILSQLNLPSNIAYSSVSGTAWSGKLIQARVRGVSLGTVKWELSPVNLLLGELAFNVSMNNNKQFLNTELTLSSSGKISLEETRFAIDLSTLQPLTYGMPFAYEGKASGYFPVSYFLKNEYVGLNGKLSLTGIGMISPQQQRLGDFVIDFRSENEGATSGKISDNGGPLRINGTMNMKKDGAITVSAKLASTDKNGSLQQALAFFGRKDSSGSVVMNTSFKLWKK